MVNIIFTGQLSIYRDISQEVIYHIHMKTIQPYAEEAKKRLKTKTWPETMAKLGMHKQTWTAIQNGKGISDENCIRLAEVLKINPVEIMATSKALQTRGKARNIWAGVAREYESKREGIND